MNGLFGSSKFKSTYMLMLALEVSEDFEEFKDNIEQLNTFSMEKLKYFDENIRIEFLKDYREGMRMRDILTKFFGKPGEGY